MHDKVSILSGCDVTAEELLGINFQYSREDGSHVTAPIALAEGGEVMGAAHGNESRWAVLDGCLAFLNRAGTPTTIFTTCERVNGALTLKGKFVLNPGLEIVHKLSEISIAFEDRPRIHSLNS